MEDLQCHFCGMKQHRTDEMVGFWSNGTLPCSVFRTAMMTVGWLVDHGGGDLDDNQPADAPLLLW